MGFDFRNAFSPDFTGSEVSERSNQQISDGFSSGATITNGVLLRSVPDSGTVQTKLGRPWIGYIVCGQDANSTDPIQANFDNRDALELTGAGGTCNIWVF